MYWYDIVGGAGCDTGEVRMVSSLSSAGFVDPPFTLPLLLVIERCRYCCTWYSGALPQFVPQTDIEWSTLIFDCSAAVAEIPTGAGAGVALHC